jgi:hypothetical protein
VKALSSTPLLQKGKKRKEKVSQEWWYIPAIPAFRWLRWENHKLEGSLEYIVKPWLKPVSHFSSTQATHPSIILMTFKTLLTVLTAVCKIILQ